MDDKLFEKFMNHQKTCYACDQVMEQYGTKKLFIMSKAMHPFGNFIMETAVIFDMVSLEVLKTDVKNYVKDSDVYFRLDNQVFIISLLMFHIV